MRALLVVILTLISSAVTRGERYLTRPEAEKLCFPAATKFEQSVFKFRPEHVQTVEKETGLRVMTEGVKVTYAFADTTFLGVVIFDHVLGKHEIIDYAVAISAEGKVVQVEILEYRESYGGEIRGKRWRDQFVGKSRSSKLKLNSDVYNISGATMSCRHVTEGVKRDLAIFHLLPRRGDALASAELPKSARAAK